jgi:4-hydroxy-tetrahydrodipicolinate reductase
MRVKVGVAGATGRMGRLIIDQIIKNDYLSLVAATTSVSNNLIGTMITEHVFLHANPEELFKKSQIVIDFTRPEILEEHLNLALRYQTKLVIGTTGLTLEHKEMLVDASKKIPLLYASNTSMGITLMKSLTTQIAKILSPEFDIEIDEIHHRHKVDAPSGTSLSLGEAAAKGRGTSLKDVACHNRHGHIGPRPTGQIGFSVRRGGSVIGDHTVSFIGEEECLEITHKGLSRSLYAKGAVRAARWLSDKSAGLYSMEDVLGLSK